MAHEGRGGPVDRAAPMVAQRADAQRADAQRADAQRADAQRADAQRAVTAFDHVPVGVITTSLAAGRPGAYLTVNEAYCRMVGYGPTDLIGNDFLGDVHPADQPALDDLLQKVLAGESGSVLAQTHLVREDGEIVPVRVTGAAIAPPAGERYLVSYVEDVTGVITAAAERQRLELELRQSRRLETLGHLVGGIAHDFNNLLAVIANYASLVREEVMAAEATDSATRWEPVRWDVENIEQAADRAKRLIKQLNAFARRDTARPDAARPRLMDLGLLVSDVGRLLGQVLGEQVRLVTRPAADLWPVEADPGQLEQAMVNIAVNARDAMPAGGQLTIDTANVSVGPPLASGDRAQAPGRYVRLRVTCETQASSGTADGRAFAAFFARAGGAADAANQAPGLGLSAARSAITHAGGTATVQPDGGNGVTISVMLPAASERAAPPAATAAPAGPAAGPPTVPWLAGAHHAAAHDVPAPRVPVQQAAAAAAPYPHQDAAHQGAETERIRTVLVVDDEPAIRDMAHRVLTRSGYLVMTAATGPDALILLGDPSVPLDLLLTDVVMPGMAGTAFAAQVQAARPGARVLFMSGYAPPVLAAEGWPDLGTEFLDKPFSRATLLAKVNELLVS